MPRKIELHMPDIEIREGLGLRPERAGESRGADIMNHTGVMLSARGEAERGDGSDMTAEPNEASRPSCPNRGEHIQHPVDIRLVGNDMIEGSRGS